MRHSRFLLLVVLLALPWVAAFAPPRQDSPRIELAISAGYDGYIRQGQWVAVRVSTANNGPNLEGELRVRTGGLGGLGETTYRTPISLPQDVRKETFLFVSVESAVQRLQVEVVDRGGEVVERASVRIQLASRNDILYAVVTESALGAVDLSGLYPGSGEARQVNWQRDDIPPIADALAGLDVMMFHDFDTGTLSAEQVEAITLWVLGGGHLIIAGGEFWQRTTAAFADLLPVTLEGTLPAETLAPLADYLRVDAEPLDAGTTLTRTTVDSRAETLVRTGADPLIVRGQYGSGVVDFLAADPQSEPLRSWSSIDRLWYTLVSSTGQRPSWTLASGSSSMAREATLTSSKTVLPSFTQLCGFLALYIGLVGPVNYLVLKRLNRREWAWLSIPLLIGVFSVVAYSIGFSLRGNVPTLNRLAAVTVWPESERARVEGVVGVQSPRRAAYNLAVSEDYTLRTLPDVGTGLGIPVTISEGQRYVAEDVPIDAGMVASFATSGSTSLPAIEAQVNWRLSNTSARVSGEVTNTLGRTLQDAVVLIKGESRYLGTLEPGESREFEMLIGPQDPGPLGLGNFQPRISVTASPWGYTNRLSWCFTPDGVAITIADVMRSEPFRCEAGLSQREHEIRRRYRLLSSMVVDFDLSGGRGSGVYLFGWTREAPFETELFGRSHEQEDTALYMIELPVSVESVEETATVPPGLTTWTMVRDGDPRTAFHVTPTNFQLNGNEQALFEFMPMPGMRLARVDALTIGFEAQGALRLDVWNWHNETWSQVTIDPATREAVLTRPAALVGPENAVRVRIALEDPTLFNEVDYVKVAYSGVLRAAQTAARQG